MRLFFGLTLLPKANHKTDADLVIAATAQVHQRELVTGNLAHFDWISDLTVTNWRK